MFKIIIDADACPKGVLEISKRISKQRRIELWTVASFNHNISSDNHITTGNSSQEADLQVVNLTKRGDIVITQDWGLAAIVLAKGGKAMSPLGRIYREETIDFMLEEREIKAKYRRGGGRTKGPHKRTVEDDTNFENQLIKLIGEIERTQLDS